jgi:steroid delta-isomerase-like uncharacterized protein
MVERDQYDTITTEFLDSFLEGYGAAWAAGDGQQMAALCAPDVVWVDAAWPEPARGPDEVARIIEWNFIGVPDLHFEADEPPAISADGKTAYLRWVLKGTNTGPIDPPGFAATGRSLDVPGLDEYRFRDGLLAHYEAYYNQLPLLRQIGVVPTHESRLWPVLMRLQHLSARRIRR